ncbi:MAG TPA: M14 family metallopeptidase [Acidobacteriota bacterium]|nr:M14 family metallopeptidase [Acidobacteriota bacterium]
MRFVQVVLLMQAATVLPLVAATLQDQPKTNPELTNYEETSRYADVVTFLKQLEKKSDALRLEFFGQTSENRALPLVICANPPVSQPREALESGKMIVLVMANIHAGEVEGKEAVQIIARRIATGDLRPLLDRLIVLLAPIYNADGNERISMENRTAQNGPIGGVGRRENAQGLDLNRDYMKLESPEARALVRLFNRWDPHLTMDLHTSDGSYHGYHLTFSPPLNPDADERIISLERNRMLPEISKAMLSRHKFRTYYYGNFSIQEQLDREFAGYRPGSAGEQHGTRIWRTFDHHPRFGNNYVGLRNRLALLSEAYSYLEFRSRIAVTEAFVEEALKYSAVHSREIVRLIRRIDEDTVLRPNSAVPAELGIEFQVRPLPKPVQILIGQVGKSKNPRSGRDMTVMIENKFTPARMLNYGIFAATRRIALPTAYIIRAEPGTKSAVGKLLEHGIAAEELAEPAAVDAEGYVIDSVKRAERAYQGHRETRVGGHWQKDKISFPAGSILVRTTQPLANLAFYLLEPESDDGLVVWNFLDAYLNQGIVYPIYKLAQNPKLATRLIER